MKEVLAKAESKMGKTIARLESDYAAIRAGRVLHHHRLSEGHQVPDR